MKVNLSANQMEGHADDDEEEEVMTMLVITTVFMIVMALIAMMMMMMMMMMMTRKLWGLLTITLLGCRVNHSVLSVLLLILYIHS